MSHERVWAWVTHPEAKMENIWVFSIFGWKIFAYLHQLWQVKASTNNLLSFNRKGYSYFLQSIVIIGLIFDHLIHPWSASVISQDKRKKKNFVFHILIQLLALQLSRVKLLGGNVTLCKTVQTGVMSKAVVSFKNVI